MRGPATPSAEPLPGMPARRFGHRSPFARRYSGSLEIDFLSSGYLDVSVPRVVFVYLLDSIYDVSVLSLTGCPIRISVILSLLAAPHSFSQLTASFFDS